MIVSSVVERRLVVVGSAHQPSRYRLRTALIRVAGRADASNGLFFDSTPLARMMSCTHDSSDAAHAGGKQSEADIRIWRFSSY